VLYWAEVCLEVYSLDKFNPRQSNVEPALAQRGKITTASGHGL
jgi:hypothetical protein